MEERREYGLLKSSSHSVLNSLKFIIFNLLINIYRSLDKLNYSDNSGTVIEDTTESLNISLLKFQLEPTIQFLLK